MLQGHGLPRDVVQSPHLEAFQNHVDVALRDVVGGHGGVRVGSEILEGFSSLNDSVIL